MQEEEAMWNVYKLIKCCDKLKGTLSQIWKCPYIFVLIWKWHPDNFAFCILRILELFPRKVCKIFVYKHAETIE